MSGKERWGRHFADFKGQNKVEVNNASMPFPNIAVLLSHLDMQSATAPYLAQDSLDLIRHSNYSRLYQRQKQILKETSHKKSTCLDFSMHSSGDFSPKFLVGQFCMSICSLS